MTIQHQSIDPRVTQRASITSTLPTKGRLIYCSTNAIFGKVGRFASDEVVLQLSNKKCIPSLLYVLEACPLVKSELSMYTVRLPYPYNLTRIINIF